MVDLATVTAIQLQHSLDVWQHVTRCLAHLPAAAQPVILLMWIGSPVYPKATRHPKTTPRYAPSFSLSVLMGRSLCLGHHDGFYACDAERQCNVSSVGGDVKSYCEW